MKVVDVSLTVLRCGTPAPVRVLHGCVSASLSYSMEQSPSWEA
jgi:hypothetical protein